MIWIIDRNRGPKKLGVWMETLPQDLSGRAHFCHPSQVDDHYAITQVLERGEIVRDEHHGDVLLDRQISQEME